MYKIREITIEGYGSKFIPQRFLNGTWWTINRNMELHNPGTSYTDFRGLTDTYKDSHDLIVQYRKKLEFRDKVRNITKIVDHPVEFNEVIDEQQWKKVQSPITLGRTG